MAAGKAMGKAARNKAKAAGQAAKHGSKKVVQRAATENIDSVTQRAAKNVVKGASNVFEDFHMRTNGPKNVFSQAAPKAASRTTRNVDDIMDSLNNRAAKGYDFNQIQTNKGQGFFKTIINNASKVMDGPIGKKFDNHTGLPSFVKGFTKKEGSQYQGGIVSRASQNAGYIKKNAAGEITDIDYGKIAKGYLAASAGARVVTGGGLYKDNQGNTNIAGIPFI